MATYNWEDLDEVLQALANINSSTKLVITDTSDLEGIDRRVFNNYPEFLAIKNLRKTLEGYRDSEIPEAQQYYEEAVQAAKETERDNQGRTFNPAATDSNVDRGTDNHTDLDFTIDPSEWADLPSNEKEAIIKKLKELGFTDDEIQKIINGETPVPKLTLDKVAGDLEELYKLDPSLRQKLKDLYGFDIFNDDGTINKTKLALALLMDKRDPNDAYDLQKLISDLKYGQKTTPEVQDQGNEITPVPTTEPAQVTLATDPPIESIVTGGAVAGGTMGAANAVESVAETLAEEHEKDLAGILGDLTGSVGRLGKAVAPDGGMISTNKGGAGLIAGAGLAAAGALGGGGAYAHHSLMTLTFTPDDFYSLSDDDQNAIINDMRKTGYTEDEINTFKESDFSVDDSFLSDITKAVKKAAEMNDGVKDQIRDKYGYDLLDALKKVDKYKLFATSLIDGKNASDDFNLFNILNPLLADTDLTNLTYFGLIMEEVILTEEVAKKLGILDKLGRTYKFTQADYESQDDYTKSAIISTLTAAGLNSDEIEKMKTETFKVKTSKMNPIIDILEKINEEQSNFAQKLTDLYKYSLIDAEGKVDKYRLFVAMIIDGYSLVDDYNIYKLIVEATGDEKTNNPDYDGLKIEDVIVEQKAEEEVAEEAENLGQLNVTEEELSEDGMGVAEAAVKEMRDSNPTTTEKDWLKDLGIQ